MDVIRNINMCECDLDQTICLQQTEMQAITQCVVAHF